MVLLRSRFSFRRSRASRSNRPIGRAAWTCIERRHPLATSHARRRPPGLDRRRTRRVDIERARSPGRSRSWAASPVDSVRMVEGSLLMEAAKPGLSISSIPSRAPCCSTRDAST